LTAFVEVASILLRPHFHWYHRHYFFFIVFYVDSIKSLHNLTISNMICTCLL